jgi:uncharacterized repeat protein (TIGR01451 family)
MNQRALLPDWRRGLLAAAGFALLVLAVFVALAAAQPPAARAQGSLGMAISKTLDGSPIVRVGQYITFTIRITNTGTISITSLPVIDNFDAKVLRLDQTDPPASAAGNGQITWTNLPTATLSGPMPPGAVITIQTRFRVIGISDLTVNKVRVEDARGWGGQSGGSGGSQGGGTAEGGRVILEKKLTPESALVSGAPITFTISVRNDGAADLVKVPVQDTYPAEYLQFWRALPPPTTVTTGALQWDNVLPQLGLSRLHPNEIITITTVFTALKSVDTDVLNSAGAAGVRDEFQNELAAPRRAEVPIQILPGPGEATPTPKPRERKPSEQPTPTPTVLPTAAITPTAELTATMPISAEAAIMPTATIAPASLPRTSGVDPPLGWLAAAAGLVGVGMLALLYATLTRRSEEEEEQCP